MSNKIKFFSKTKDGLRCEICPHLCVLKSGDRGKCRSRFNADGIVKNVYDGTYSGITVSSIREKPFYHFLKGSKTLSVGGFGCNLGCVFCENHEISQMSSFDFCERSLSADSIANMAIDEGCKSVCMTYNEPSISIEMIEKLYDSCKKNNLKLCIKTNAYVNKKAWSFICKNVDAINIDWKGFREAYKIYCNVSDYVVEDRIKEAYSYGKHLEISLLVLFFCGYRFKTNLSYVADFISSLSTNIPTHIVKLVPAYKFYEVSPDIESIYPEARSILLSKLSCVY